MIGKIASYFVKRMKKYELVEENAWEEVYRYGIEIMISSTLNILIVLLEGWICRMFLESILFLICFISLRIYAGGYHADTYLKCNLVFGSITGSVFVVYKLIGSWITMPELVIISIMTLGLLFYMAPVENKNNPIQKEDIKRYKNKSIKIAALEILVMLISARFSGSISTIIIFAMLEVDLFIFMEIYFRRKERYVKKSREKIL